MPAPTMLDVARRAGVHPATVSRALRDDPRISPAQRAKVRAAAAALDYRTNPLVAALMRVRRSRGRTAYRATLACLTHCPAERLAFFRAEFGDLIAGARLRAVAQGYLLEEINTHDPALSPARLTEILLHRGIHGLLVAPLHSVNEPLDLDWSRFATVAIGYSLRRVPVSRVAHNHVSGLALAAEACRAAGRRRLGLAVPRRVHEKVERRWLAALLLEQSAAPADAVAPFLPDDWTEAGFAAWFRREKPDAVLCLDAPAVLAWLARLGPAGRAASVIALDRRPRDRGTAGIDQDYPRLGAAAADAVIGLLQRNELGLPEKPLALLLDGAWVPGRTLRPAVSARPASRGRWPRPTPVPAPA